jgi:hypothetical protein
MLLIAGLLAAPAVAAKQQALPQETPLHEQWQPLIKDPDSAGKAGPAEAPPGKLCLVETPQPCGDKAELIQRPYTGGAELHYLEPLPAKPDRNPGMLHKNAEKPNESANRSPHN